MSETIKSQTNCPTCRCEVDIQGETTHFYVPKKRYSEKQVIDYARFCVESDRQGMPLLEFNDYLQHYE